MVVHIVATGYNCADNVKKFVDSVRAQTNRQWILHLVNDGSTDKTGLELAINSDHKNIFVHSYTDNQGAACRRWEVIKDLPPDSIVALAGLDDELLPNCVEKIIEQHKAGKWMTYGNWINQKGKGLLRSFPLEFSELTHFQRSYRKEVYRSTAINTFRAFLFQAIPVDDFKINGKWIDSTTESEVMFSCLEMCGKDRIGIIYDKIYLYNEHLPNGTLRRLGREHKYKLLDIIRARPAKPLYEYLMKKQEEETTTKTTKTKWESATSKLQARRDTGVQDNAKCDTIVGDYYRHMRSFSGVGESVLDVGCGSQHLRRVVDNQHAGVKYVGIDAFPAPVSEGEVLKVKIENDKEVAELLKEHGQFDTVCCFAALDSMHDLVKATANMKKLAKERVCFLTGIGIKPDEFHTFEITTDLLNELMSGWKVKMSNFLTQKVLLIEYVPE